MKKLAIFFPGAGYGMDCPLLYYTDFLYETLGFERLKLNYQEILMQKEIPLEEKLKKLRSYIEQSFETIDFSSYNEIVFIAKSIGCVEAGLIADKYVIPFLKYSKIKFQQFFLTPTPEALTFCGTSCCIIIGTRDKAYELFKSHCDANEVPILTITSGDHSLELIENPIESIDVLKNVLEYFFKAQTPNAN